MTNSIVLSPEQFIFAQDSELKTTSLKVAEAFGKLHKDVLRKIETIDCSKEFSGRNFTLAEYLDGQGKKRPSYEMTKDGFIFVIMGFTGKKAAGIKESYINAFNLMHKKLFPVRNALIELSPLSPAQKNHIQNEVKRLVNTQVGTTYRGMWSSIKDEFKVGTYKEIPADKYPDVCEFLRCKPIEGELMPLENTLTDEMAIDQLRSNGYLVAPANKGGIKTLLVDWIPAPLFYDLVDLVGWRVRAIGIQVK